MPNNNITIKLDEIASGDAIEKATAEVSKEFNRKLIALEKHRGQYGGITKIFDQQTYNEVRAKTSYDQVEAKEVATFETELPLEFFADKTNDIDIFCNDLKYEDDLYTKARKRCRHIIRNEFTRWFDQIRLVDKDFLLAEANAAIDDINSAIGLRLYIVKHHYDFGALTIYITDRRLPDDISHSVIISKEEYTDDTSAYDNMIGVQHMKAYDGRFNGRLRVSYIIFNVFRNGVQSKYPETYKSWLNK